VHKVVKFSNLNANQSAVLQRYILFRPTIGFGAKIKNFGAPEQTGKE
jgi:hypothetical protein